MSPHTTECSRGLYASPCYPCVSRWTRLECHGHGKDSGLYFHFPPLANVTDNNTSGYFPDLYRKLFSYISVGAEYRTVPIARYNELFKEGKIEIGFWPWGFKSQNHTDLGYAGDVNYGIYSKKKVDDYKKLTGCAVNNIPITLPTKNMYRNNTFEGCLNMLEYKRVDYIFALKPIIQKQLIKEKSFYQSLGSLKLYLYVHNKHKSHFTAFQTALKESRSREIHQKILPRLHPIRM